jgi:hypothetical protein
LRQLLRIEKHRQEAFDGVLNGEPPPLDPLALMQMQVQAQTQAMMMQQQQQQQQQFMMMQMQHMQLQPQAQQLLPEQSKFVEGDDAGGAVEPPAEEEEEDPDKDFKVLASKPPTLFHVCL